MPSVNKAHVVGHGASFLGRQWDALELQPRRWHSGHGGHCWRGNQRARVCRMGWWAALAIICVISRVCSVLDLPRAFLDEMPWASEGDAQVHSHCVV